MKSPSVDSSESPISLFSVFVRIKQTKISTGGPSSMPQLVIMTRRESTWRKDMTRSWLEI